MSRIVEVIDQLDNLLSLKPATADEVRNIENELQLSLAEEYKEYLLKYGAIMADDTELTGFAKSKNRDVVNVTKREWEANRKIKQDLYVVENVAIDGIIIWQNHSGEIFESTPDNEAKRIADSLAEYLIKK